MCAPNPPLALENVSRPGTPTHPDGRLRTPTLTVVDREVSDGGVSDREVSDREVSYEPEELAVESNPITTTISHTEPSPQPEEALVCEGDTIGMWRLHLPLFISSLGQVQIDESNTDHCRESDPCAGEDRTSPLQVSICAEHQGNRC